MKGRSSQQSSLQTTLPRSDTSVSPRSGTGMSPRSDSKMSPRREAVSTLRSSADCMYVIASPTIVSAADQIQPITSNGLTDVTDSTQTNTIALEGGPGIANTLTLADGENIHHTIGYTVIPIGIGGNIVKRSKLNQKDYPFPVKCVIHRRTRPVDVLKIPSAESVCQGPAPNEWEKIQTEFAMYRDHIKHLDELIETLIVMESSKVEASLQQKEIAQSVLPKEVDLENVAEEINTDNFRAPHLLSTLQRVRLPGARLKPTNIPKPCGQLENSGRRDGDRFEVSTTNSAMLVDTKKIENEILDPKYRRKLLKPTRRRLKREMEIAMLKDEFTKSCEEANKLEDVGYTNLSRGDGIESISKTSESISHNGDDTNGLTSNLEIRLTGNAEALLQQKEMAQSELPKEVDSENVAEEIKTDSCCAPHLLSTLQRVRLPGARLKPTNIPKPCGQLENSGRRDGDRFEVSTTNSAMLVDTKILENELLDPNYRRKLLKPTRRRLKREMEIAMLKDEFTKSCEEANKLENVGFTNLSRGDGTDSYSKTSENILNVVADTKELTSNLEIRLEQNRVETPAACNVLRDDKKVETNLSVQKEDERKSFASRLHTDCNWAQPNLNINRKPATPKMDTWKRNVQSKGDTGRNTVQSQMDTVRKSARSKVDTGREVCGSKTNTERKVLPSKIDTGRKLIQSKMYTGRNVAQSKIDTGRKAVSLPKIDTQRSDGNSKTNPRQPMIQPRTENVKKTIKSKIDTGIKKYVTSKINTGLNEMSKMPESSTKYDENRNYDRHDVDRQACRPPRDGDPLRLPKNVAAEQTGGHDCDKLPVRHKFHKYFVDDRARDSEAYITAETMLISFSPSPPSGKSSNVRTRRKPSPKVAKDYESQGGCPKDSGLCDGNVEQIEHFKDIKSTKDQLCKDEKCVPASDLDETDINKNLIEKDVESAQPLQRPKPEFIWIPLSPSMPQTNCVSFGTRKRRSVKHGKHLNDVPNPHVSNEIDKAIVKNNFIAINETVLNDTNAISVREDKSPTEREKAEALWISFSPTPPRAPPPRFRRPMCRQNSAKITGQRV